MTRVGTFVPAATAGGADLATGVETGPLPAWPGVPTSGIPFVSSLGGVGILSGDTRFTRRATRAIFWGLELPQEATGGDEDRDEAGLLRFVAPDGT